jgi:hypothetical protein
MTVSTTGNSSVAGYDPASNLGFEDVDASDLQMPRLRIDGPKALFVDSLTQKEYPALDVVILGLVKGRVMWNKVVDDGDRPMCKSPDTENGFPNVSEQTPRSKRFPFSISNFQPQDFPAEQGINGHVTLPCGSCKFKEWGKDEDGKSTPPPCAEQHIFPLLYLDPEDGSMNPAILTLKGSGIKPSKAYVGGFMRTRQPMFSVMTHLTLQPMNRGSVNYAVPILRRGEVTDQEEWGEYANLYYSSRDYLRQPPRPGEDAGDGSGAAQPAASSNVNAAPTTAAPATVAAAPVTAPTVTPAPVVTPAATEPAGDPWATGPSGAPAASAPAPAATPAPAPAAASAPDDDLPF